MPQIKFTQILLSFPLRVFFSIFASELKKYFSAIVIEIAAILWMWRKGWGAIQVCA